MVKTLTFFLLFASFAGGAQKESVTIYSPVGKRDPFKAPPIRTGERDLAAVSPLERYSLDQFQLRAILRGMGRPRAMFEDPEGKTHIVTEGTVIGRERGTVSHILDSDVMITERTFNYLGQENLTEKVLSLPKDAEQDLVTSSVPAVRENANEDSGTNATARAFADFMKSAVGNGQGNMGGDRASPSPSNLVPTPPAGASAPSNGTDTIRGNTNGNLVN